MRICPFSDDFRTRLLYRTRVFLVTHEKLKVTSAGNASAVRTQDPPSAAPDLCQLKEHFAHEQT